MVVQWALGADRKVNQQKLSFETVDKTIRDGNHEKFNDSGSDCTYSFRVFEEAHSKDCSEL